MSKSFKRVLLVLLIPIVLVVVIAVIVQEVQESDLKRAEARNDVAASMSDLQDRTRALEEKHYENLAGLGTLSDSILRACFAYGYPEHGHLVAHDLSRRRVDECDQIIKRLDKEEARFRAEEAQKDAEYEKAHPVK